VESSQPFGRSDRYGRPIVTVTSDGVNVMPNKCVAAMHGCTANTRRIQAYARWKRPLELPGSACGLNLHHKRRGNGGKNIGRSCIEGVPAAALQGSG
jgi:hypothetical protein